MKRLAFLASYNGSSAKAIVAACKDGTLNAQPVLLLSNNPNSNALIWAKDTGIKTAVVKGKDEEVRDILISEKIDMVILSGYMKLIGPLTVRAFPERILNIHPALLPKFGGKGMYGRHVHEAVKASGEKETGITIHYVDEIYDHGKIVGQKRISLDSTDTIDEIEIKVRTEEPAFYVETLKSIL